MSLTRAERVARGWPPMAPLGPTCRTCTDCGLHRCPYCGGHTYEHPGAEHADRCYWPPRQLTLDLTGATR